MWFILIIILVVVGAIMLARRTGTPVENKTQEFLRTQQNRSKEEASGRYLPSSPPFSKEDNRGKISSAAKTDFKKTYLLEYDCAYDFDKYPFEIVGESHYQSNISRFAVKRDGKGCFTEVEARVVRDLNNSHDKNACKVDINGLTVGYFPRNNAESWVKLLNRLNMPENSEVHVRAVIIGGGIKDHSFGVKLDIPSRIANSAKYIKEI